MIKVDRKNHICDLHGESDEILLDVQLVLHKAVRDVAVKTAGTLKLLPKQCAALLLIH